jgi:hypothetical protein
MSAVKREVWLLILAVVVLTLSLIVLIRNRDIDTDLLAALGLLGGVAMIVVALPSRNGKKGEE